MPILNPERYAYIPPWEKINLPNGTLYFFDSSLDENQTFRTNLAQVLSSNDPKYLGREMGDARANLVRKIKIDDTTTVVFKRTFGSREHLAWAFRHGFYSPGTRADTNYLEQVSIQFQAREEYKKAFQVHRRQNPSLPEELSLEELSSVYLGNNGDYWMIFKYYPPIIPSTLPDEEKKEYWNTVRQLSTQADFLESHSSLRLGQPVQHVVTRSSLGGMEARIVDTEHFYREIPEPKRHRRLNIDGLVRMLKGE